MEHTLEVHGLTKRYKDFVLEDVSFNVPPGRIMGLIGPNGAGKTTIIKLIMNLLRRDGGSVRLFGLDSLTHEAEVKTRIGFVYDEPPFHQDVPLSRLKAAIAPFYPGWDEARFLSLCRRFELPLGKKLKKLSQGMKSKFALSLALSHKADLIIMDEPTSGMDPIFRRELLDILSELVRDEGKSILFSTHITSDLERIADAITMVKDGRLVFSSTRDQIMDNWAIVRGGEELLTNGLKKHFLGHRITDVAVEALTSNAAQVRLEVPEGVLVERASLEDIVFFLKKGETHA